ncbi:hypothetical protein NPIL_473901 [Nephila pilipes]|uniref:Uncharacterized protein n=1 Tax=Nephila pilipes TaxID=299642 RepID=A0A8X6NPL5_NEPPI|nr:hypothetical protein NPIL_473901 [Nephila pilipes]
MADISEENPIRDPQSENQKRYQEIQIMIMEYTETIKAMAEVEAKIKSTQLLQLLYGPQDRERYQNEIARWNEEKSRLEVELNLSVPCPITGCLHHAQILQIKSNLNLNRKPNLTQNIERQLEVSSEGFKTPAKTAKQPKVISSTITKTVNKFNTLRINNQVDVAEAIPPPSDKIPPVMLRLTSNYNLLL